MSIWFEQESLVANTAHVWIYWSPNVAKLSSAYYYSHYNLCRVDRLWSTMKKFGTETVDTLVKKFFMHPFWYQWDLEAHIQTSILISIEGIFFPLVLPGHLVTPGQLGDRNIMSDIHRLSDDNFHLVGQLQPEPLYFCVKNLLQFGHVFRRISSRETQALQSGPWEVTSPHTPVRRALQLSMWEITMACTTSWGACWVRNGLLFWGWIRQSSMTTWSEIVSWSSTMTEANWQGINFECQSDEWIG